MKKTLLLAIAAIFPVVAHAENENITDNFTSCMATEDDKQRLACYDKIRDEIIKKYGNEKLFVTTEYKPMELIDLKLDIKSLPGTKVSVTGLLQVIGDTILLKSEELDMAPIILNSSSMAREERKKLLQDCTKICAGKIEGVVEKNVVREEIKVEHIYLSKS